MLKRTLDIVLSALMLVVLSPLFVVLALVVWSGLGRPVVFRQMRAGKGGKLFALYKFSTMTQAKDAAGVLLPDSDRLTRLGRFLRACSLDELPQLWNVLRGDMSFVGPRPLLPAYLERYNAEQARRHEVRPGITGWAQVHGRNRLSWPEKFAYDVWYVDHQSGWLDARILLLTAKKLFAFGEVNQAEGVTMEEFRGNE